jgi:DNA polymerase III delta prime subunit
VGKRMMALEFIKSLNCKNSINGFSCGICDVCLRIEKNLHEEVKIISPINDTISIEEIREIQRLLSLKLLNIKVRSFLIEEADRFSIEAANCFLKCLEEPPENTLFILLSSKKSKLSKTIISRCKEVKFHPLSEKEQKEILKEWKMEENLEFLINISEGSIGKIKKYFQFNAYSYFLKIAEWIPNLIKKDLKSYFQICEEINSINNKEIILTILDLFIYYFSLPILKPEEYTLPLKESTLKRFISLVEETKKNILQRVNLSLCIEVMLLNILEAEDVQYCGDKVSL